MRRIILTTIATLCLAGTAMADPVLGTWKTQPGDDGAFGHIRVAKCGDAICGYIAKAFNSAGKQIESDTVGKRMIWAMQADGDSTYSGGKIWAPDRDKTYNSVMELNGSRLVVKGCFFGICRGQTWTRVSG
ncbi:DUF2147 domain-containing protein [Parasulfitobacter algicola]|uniref:DUF2147 domain-containing protein n=1 Tax=Parasulfitobacter algicola TaxID=2614809 RepID=A0ABX2IQ98_9RHOB|nr:DUF2147 domain-containing protein [Sulfitobacter algicola]NSX54191.1 DUF2147 domain-containing protein [Sulfitobacter algicola]